MRCRGRYWPTRKAVTKDWRKFFGEELHYLCCLEDIRLTTSTATRFAKREIRTGVC
jgi:hypothetical protein